MLVTFTELGAPAALSNKASQDSAEDADGAAVH